VAYRRKERVRCSELRRHRGICGEIVENKDKSVRMFMKGKCFKYKEIVKPLFF
jgi:hypothetical protein